MHALVTALLTFTALSGAGPFSAERQEPKIQAVIEVASPEEWERLLAVAGLDIISVEKGRSARIVTDRQQLEGIQQLGFAISIEIENLQDFYASRLGVANFGEYHTYSETVEFLDWLHATYPAITTDKLSIGTSVENRPIWAMKISDNPDIAEDEPEVLFDGLHHAREPITVEALIYCMSWLCEHYATDVDAAFLVDNREIWFVPIMNPDGYVFNELTCPEGGGMWRKNRRDNGDGTWGVDLNRNYPFRWGGVEASDVTSDETYRGPYPASEPEVCALINLMKAHEFVAHISFHSCAAMVLLPWSYTDEPPPDEWLLRRWGTNMAVYNGYQVGQNFEILYMCSGTTTDYAYGERIEKNRIFSTAIEVSGSGFWPRESEIPALQEQCLWPMIYTAWVAGEYVALTGTRVVGGDGDSSVEGGESLDILLTLENQSLQEDVQSVRAVLRSDDAFVEVTDAVTSVGGIEWPFSTEITADPMHITVDTALPPWHAPVFCLTLETQRPSWDEPLRFPAPAYSECCILADDMENGAANWRVEGTWALTHRSFHSPTTSFTDSPSGCYFGPSDSWIELVTPFDLSQADSACLMFWHLPQLCGGSDRGLVEISPDGGVTWEQTGEGYTGWANGWTREALSLASHLGERAVSVRFRLQTGEGGTGDGWYVDDVTVGPPERVAPAPESPIPLHPVPDELLQTPSPTLVVRSLENGTPGHPLTYGFKVYADELLTERVASVAGLSATPDSVEWTLDVSLPDGAYWWRAYADDGEERSLLTPASGFAVAAGVVGLPDRVRLLQPAPNPFAGDTEIAFELPSRAAVRVDLHDLYGRRVRRLFDRVRGAGRWAVPWDGCDEEGNRVPSGTYVVTLSALGFGEHRVLVALK